MAGIGPLEDELRARMDDLRRFEDMLARARAATAKADKERNEVRTPTREKRERERRDSVDAMTPAPVLVSCGVGLRY